MCAILVPGKSIIILKFRSREKISKMKLIFNVEIDRIHSRNNLNLRLFLIKISFNIFDD